MRYIDAIGIAYGILNKDLSVIESLEKDKLHYEECLSKNSNNCITEAIVEEIESIKQRIA